MAIAPQKQAPPSSGAPTLEVSSASEETQGTLSGAPTAEDLAQALAGVWESDAPDTSQGSKAETAANQTAEAPRATGLAPCALKDRYNLFPGMALHDFDTPSAKAYHAEDNRNPERNLYVLICNPALPIRQRELKAVTGSALRGLITVIDHGPVEWPLFEQRAMAIVYERPMGGRFLDASSKRKIKINEYEIPRKIIAPLLASLNDLAELGVTHRNIRLENLYFLDKERHQLVLGDFVSAPPGYHQPAVYEPVTRAMAMPSGRGSGNLGIDIYTLGVLLVFLLVGRNPMGKMTDEEMITSKCENGSYAALCGRERIPMTILEPLRGMLSDDPDERWDLNAIELWLNGQKKTPIQRRPVPKPKTRINFMGKDHKTTRTLAFSMGRHVSEAAQLIKDGKLEVWLRQSLDMGDRADAVTAAIAHAKVNDGRFEGSDDYFVCKVCAMIDPNAPLLYKGLSFLPEGFGYVLGVSVLFEENIQAASEVLHHNIAAFWFASQTHFPSETLGMNKSFQSLMSLIKINEMGFGIERCLYELLPGLPCQSPLIKTAYVTEIEGLLPALDDVANNTETQTKPIDRHIAAFIAARFKHDISPHLKALSDPKEETATIGMLSLLALVQWRLKIPTLFGLSSWIGGQLGAAIATYHSRATRRKIEQAIPSLVRKGSLPELFDLIDNIDKRRSDIEGFEEAKSAFFAAEKEILSLIGDDENGTQKAQQSGEHFTAMFAIIVCLIASSIILMVKMM
ncbi:protein kinase domain-containing protein [Varunaivibrio sulfuroxidans]|uniref:non-specific serine/threonine protein kinase n=1 Tax=Varunaivibrio sulfuroxidans TaxID=1773489 RepID=A0A4R3JAE0_9PROT|nr:hypothetical protein [Varunaivibrio sulfuroxidans]TCS62514.1 protein kinase-like protein [Varunaivibrio sulfuroxidans]WES30815.1 hypothetical protein P3M64_00105 [Varunaivibrio sulfuroxidans]